MKNVITSDEDLSLIEGEIIDLKPDVLWIRPMQGKEFGIEYKNATSDFLLGNKIKAVIKGMSSTPSIMKIINLNTDRVVACYKEAKEDDIISWPIAGFFAFGSLGLAAIFVLLPIVNIFVLIYFLGNKDVGTTEIRSIARTFALKASTVYVVLALFIATPALFLLPTFAYMAYMGKALSLDSLRDVQNTRKINQLLEIEESSVKKEDANLESKSFDLANS
jgi:hypothetical protein